MITWPFLNSKIMLTEAMEDHPLSISFQTTEQLNPRGRAQVLMMFSLNWAALWFTAFGFQFIVSINYSPWGHDSSYGAQWFQKNLKKKTFHTILRLHKSWDEYVCILCLFVCNLQLGNLESRGQQLLNQSNWNGLMYRMAGPRTPIGMKFGGIVNISEAMTQQICLAYY